MNGQTWLWPARLFNRHVGVALRWALLAAGVAVAANIVGIRVVGDVDGWARWLPPGVANVVLLVVKLVTLGMLACAAFWLALLLVFVVVWHRTLHTTNPGNGRSATKRITSALFSTIRSTTTTTQTHAFVMSGSPCATSSPCAFRSRRISPCLSRPNVRPMRSADVVCAEGFMVASSWLPIMFPRYSFHSVNQPPWRAQNSDGVGMGYWLENASKSLSPVTR